VRGRGSSWGTGQRRLNDDGELSKSEVKAMPFKSQAQRRKFAELLVQGKIKAETFEEWNRETGGRKLPERVKTKKGSAPKRKRSTAKARGRTKK
jgi:hypothetical protein